MANIQRITALARKYAADDITPAELKELNSYLNAAPGRRDRFESRVSDEALEEAIAIWEQARLSKQDAAAQFGWQPVIRPLHRFRKLRVWSAAAAVLVIGVTTFLLLPKHHPDVAPVAKSTLLPGDRAPGGNRAILALDNGSSIVLDSLAIGVVAQQGGVSVSKTRDGLLNYSSASSGSSMNYNTLTTPAGGQYQLVLSDGSKIWLNNASSLHYPASFTGSTREVELIGEAYFEVAKNAAKPFIVREGDMVVKVLGTHFNIKGYKNEGVQSTTLLEGSVSITNGSTQALLVPGDRSSLDGKGSIKLEHNVDVDEVISWKNGFFHFEGESLPDVMIQLARWYDVSVEYRGEITPQKFRGKIERSLPLSAVLHGLENPGLHFKIDGSKIVVTP